jgi:hypothetical protein
MCKLCKLWSLRASLGNKPAAGEWVLSVSFITLFKYSQSINLSKESNEKSSKIGYKCPSNFYMTIELLDKW